MAGQSPNRASSNRKSIVVDARVRDWITSRRIGVSADGSADGESLTECRENRRLSVLLLADDCNPEWPSLPIVGYKYALALGRYADVTVTTHIRNRKYIEKASPTGIRFVYLDNERVAAPLHRLALWLRRGSDVAWSTAMIMNYLPYLAFEREVWRHFRHDLKQGHFDIVHRITPMTPTLPSYIAGKTACPFVIGPLNGNLPWPASFRNEQKREKERLRFLRNAARAICLMRAAPFAKPTWCWRGSSIRCRN